MTNLECLALALFDAGADGLTRTRINGLFGGHLSALRLDALLSRLDALALVRRSWVPTAGRWATRWAPANAEPVTWEPADVEAFWREWCCSLFGAFVYHALPAPRPLARGCNEAGARGVTLALALEAVERYRRAEPSPSIDAWGVTLKKALPVALADLAGE